MRTPARLGLYGAALVAVFAVAFVTAGAVIPDETAQSWAEDHVGDHAGGHDMSTDGRTDEHGGHEASATGLALESNGYRLTALTAPTTTGAEGELALTVKGPGGEVVTDFELSHEKELHLIVVRTDGTGFRHVHPERAENGQWSIPWVWQEAGSYRVYAEFVPTATGEDTTLSAIVNVAGDFVPAVPSGPVATAESGGYELSIDGELAAGRSGTLTVTVARDGEPVTVEPYLGAFGHLVALREGDLAYLHVHSHSDAAEPGLEVAFEVTVPTEGRYLLYLDFQKGGQVHTARFVLDAAASGGSSPQSDDDHEGVDGHDHDE